MLHVSEGTGGGIYHSNSEVIIEDDAASYLQFSTPTASESGILSGNSVTSLRSALIFRADSSIQIRTGGGNTRLAILNNGNIGIGTTAPQKLLHVREGSAGVNPMSMAVGVFENNTSASINLLTPAANESGIYFGNPLSAAAGGVVYNSTPANGLSFRTNGNISRAVLDATGNFGIGDDSPNSKLHVSRGGFPGNVQFNCSSDY